MSFIPESLDPNLYVHLDIPEGTQIPCAGSQDLRLCICQEFKSQCQSFWGDDKIVSDTRMQLFVSNYAFEFSLWFAEPGTSKCLWVACLLDSLANLYLRDADRCL